MEEVITIIGGCSIDGGNFFLVAVRRTSLALSLLAHESTYVGLVLVIFSPFFDLTNSLLIKIPVGCLYLWPLGAVSSTKRSDIFEKALVDLCN